MAFYVNIYERLFNSKISKFSYHLLVNFNNVTLECVGSNVILHVQMERSKPTDVQLHILPETCSDQLGFFQPKAQASGYRCLAVSPSQPWYPMTPWPKIARQWF
jgi:hypothetical protein